MFVSSTNVSDISLATLVTLLSELTALSIDWVNPARLLRMFSSICQKRLKNLNMMIYLGYG